MRSSLRVGWARSEVGESMKGTMGVLRPQKRVRGNRSVYCFGNTIHALLLGEEGKHKVRGNARQQEGIGCKHHADAAPAFKSLECAPYE